MSDSEIAVKVDSVSKTFHIPLEASSGLKQKLINTVKGRKGYREFTPLNDISFSINKGEFFGIVGRNGSGKSTLLKTIAGIYNPTEGAVLVNGTLVPFIELGVGFNPELTGRENVFLNGALLGFSHAEMELMYDDIIDFAELGDFMHERLKNYSSGMQVRLAFSIAIRAKGDILLLDEVLAVGDEAFQRKCFDYFEKLKRNNTTVILVTHDMAAIERFCTRALFLDAGEIKMIDVPYKVASSYSRSNDDAYETKVVDDDIAEDDGYVKSQIEISLYNSQNKKAKRFDSGDVMTVELAWPEHLPGVKHAGVSIIHQNGNYIFGTNTYLDKFNMVGGTKMLYDVSLPLGEGRYFIKAALFGDTDANAIEFEDRGTEFVINRNKLDERWGGAVYLKHKWRN